MAERCSAGAPGAEDEALAHGRRRAASWCPPLWARAPHWREGARPRHRAHAGERPGALARATLEAIAYQVRDVFDALHAEAGVPLSVLHADGGATANDTLMQFQADILGAPVVRGRAEGGVGVDVSALGAAYLAGLAVGIWRGEEEIAALPGPRSAWNPPCPPSAAGSTPAGAPLWRAVCTTPDASRRAPDEHRRTPMPTLAVILGNRDFFPDVLIDEARRDILGLLAEVRVDAVLLDRSPRAPAGPCSRTPTPGPARRCSPASGRASTASSSPCRTLATSRRSPTPCASPG